MRIAIDCGHTLTGADRGASGVGGREEIRTREIGKALINLLVAQGHETIDCTLDNANSVGESLAYRVDKANKNNVDIYISIHLNAYNGEARGVETHVYNSCSQASIDYALKVQKEMCKLGYVDRGVKKGNLYVVKNTNAPAILVECGFIDNQSDMNLYNADNIASAICSAIICNTVASNNTTTQNNISDNWVYRLQGVIGVTQDNVPGPITLSKCPLIQYGSKGLIVGWVQKRLNYLGYSCGTADSDFGGNTKTAVMAFQKANGLSADGVIGPNTWRKLLEL